MLPCMFVIFHREKVVDDEVQNSIPAHQGHGAGRRWGRKRYMGAPVGVCKGGEVLRQLFRMSGKAKTLKRIKICCDDGQRPYAPLRMVGRPVAGIRPGKGAVRCQFKLRPQGPPLSPEFFVEFYGFRCAGGRKNGKEEARRTEKQGFRTVPDGTQGRPQGQVAHGGFVGVIAQRFRQVFKKGLFLSCVFGAFRMAAVLVLTMAILLLSHPSQKAGNSKRKKVKKGRGRRRAR